ncbi:pyrimidodiazepine synthase-like isoform X2 [Periplaneta americana]|uniref:pyrimidodiazepine synthase-like isoform X2 n=1 Tax=Periplaneta americana TaxID=6978 RepID=UPI0037E97E74
MGSSNPPLVQGKLRLYSMRFCPYAQRVHLVLDAKNIPYDVVNVHLGDKPDFLFEKNPLGKVPVLETEDGRCLYESLIVADYLDEQFPDRPLHSGDPAQKAQDRICLELFSKAIPLAYKVYGNADLEAFAPLMDELDVFEKELATRGTAFYAGAEPGMLDLMLWPWCQRVEMQRHLEGPQFELPQERFPRLTAWLQAMIAHEAVQLSYIPPQSYAKFISTKRAGAIDYDVLLQ